jgi:hypothetical protein
MPDLELPVYFLRVEIEILSGHESWQQLVQRICSPPPIRKPENLLT